MLNVKRLIDEFFNMVKISSPSKSEREFAQYLKKVLEDLGFIVETDDAGDKVGGNTGNVIGRLDGSDEFIPITLSAHMDTVEPCKDIIPAIEKDRIVSKGDTILGSDDKGGIAAIIEALRVVNEDQMPHGVIEVVFTICEELGLQGAKNLDVSKLKGEICYIFDSDGSPGTIVRQGPAKDLIKAEIIGKTSHAGLCPEEGISAIQIAAEAVTNMKLLRIDAETTANIGTFHGSTGTNVVCDEVTIIAEARSLFNEKLDRQTKHMVECMEMAAKKFGGRVETEVTRSYGAFNLNEEDRSISIAKKAVSNLGMTPNLVSTGGGSDANIFNNSGIPSVDLGTGMSNVHTINEYIKIEDLIGTGELVLELIKLSKK